MMDYNQLVATANAYLGSARPRITPSSIFYGRRNFMTTDVLGYHMRTGHTIEVTTGHFLEQRIFGITFDRLATDSPDERDCCLRSWDEVVAFLDALPTTTNKETSNG